MELFSGVIFFLSLAAAAIPAFILGRRQIKLKYYSFVVSLVFIYFAMSTRPAALVYLGLYCILQYIIVQVFAYRRRKLGKSGLAYFIAIVLSLAPLATYKILEAGANPYKIFAFLGISYLTFKSLQIIIELHDGLIEKVKTFDFFYFLLFFPALISGPIDRSRRFNEDINTVMSKEEYTELFGDGLLKICKGLFYKFVLATASFQLITILGSDDDWVSMLINMYSYGIYLFFDFAGYSLMAIGVSNLFGVKTPVNFNKPFISKDIREFWDRWHITLSYWFRDYVFSRITMRFVRNKWFKSKITTSSVGFIINMTIMGIWHGLSLHYILYGVYHGILLALTNWYQKKSKFYKKNKKKKWFIAVQTFVTINLVMFGFFIFSGRFTEIMGWSWEILLNWIKHV